MNKSNSIIFNNKNIAYKNNFSKVKNPYRTIVFLCGYMSDMDGTKSLFLEDFCTENNLGYVALDYSGHGKSSGDFFEGSISEWTKESLAVINELVKTPMILIGSSMGGWISLLVAIKLKKKVAGIINIASAVDFTEVLMWDSFTEKQKFDLMGKGKINIERGGSDYCITKKLIEDGRKNLLLKKIIPIDMPVVLMHGFRDESVPIEISVKLAEQLSSKNVKVILVKDSDHRMSEQSDLKLLAIEVTELVAL
ncbi:MAG: alpha/beta hydrolase [Alphaproteobacteria bacterium]|nr:alpha/beta hydrolase [Alphaproteobacteria bacterium]